MLGSGLYIVIALWICAAIITVDSIGKGFQYYTGWNHFGALGGDSAAVGAAVIILPGRYIPKIQLFKQVPFFARTKQSHKMI